VLLCHFLSHFKLTLSKKRAMSLPTES
jgi:hypothetical protein